MDLETRLRLASGAPEDQSRVLHDQAEEVLFALIDNPRFEEQQALILLSRKELSWKVLERLCERHDLLKSYRIKNALVRHPHAPRSVSLPLMRHLYLADLLKVSATPGVPADVRRVVEEQIAQRASTLSLGERVSLARQGAGRVLSALLLDKDPTVVRAALDNPRLTEDLVVRALSYESMKPEAVDLVAGHRRWSTSYSVRTALLRQPQTSLARVLMLAEQILIKDLLELLEDPRMPAARRSYLRRWAAAKSKSAR